MPGCPLPDARRDRRSYFQHDFVQGTVEGPGPIAVAIFPPQLRDHADPVALPVGGSLEDGIYSGSRVGWFAIQRGDYLIPD
jgi:hypothetical protein